MPQEVFSATFSATAKTEAVVMTTKQIALASAALIALAAVAIPNQADARWRGSGYGWRAPVAAGAVVGGLALGAAIASRPYYGYGYASGPVYGGRRSRVVSP